MDWTFNDYATLYSVAVATAAAGFSCWSVMRDKTKIVVEARADMRSTERDAHGHRDHIPHIVVIARNLGRRPVSVELACLKMRNSDTDMLMKADWNPTNRINEGESATAYAYHGVEDMDLDSVECVIVRDETGRKWTGVFKK